MAPESTLPDRIDFAVSRSCVVVTTFWSVNGYCVAPDGARLEATSFDLDVALDWCRKNGYTIRRWEGGARAWKGDQPRPVRTRPQIHHRRSQAERRAMHGDTDGALLSLDFAFEG
jgi:hypothetical protein